MVAFYARQHVELNA